MATLWLKDKEPGKEEKRFMDKKAVRAFLSRKDHAITDVKRQLRLANWTIAKLEQQIKDMDEERKCLFFTILVLTLFSVVSGVLRWL